MDKYYNLVDGGSGGKYDNIPKYSIGILVALLVIVYIIKIILKKTMTKTKSSYANMFPLDNSDKSLPYDTNRFMDTTYTYT